MRLLERILDVNQRRAAGAWDAAVPVAEFSGALPLAALTCIDVRLNHLLPDALGLPEEQFVWLRNAGAVITGPLSSTMRSLALACAIKHAGEIAIIGHTDCQVCRATTMLLLDRLAGLGVDRHRLPQNLVEFFGLSGSERQNVIRAVEFVRGSPLIGARVPVHGLMLDVSTGRLECISNGYDAPAPTLPGKAGELIGRTDLALERLEKIGHFASTELKLPTDKIGDFASAAGELLHKAEHVAAAAMPAKPPLKGLAKPPRLRPDR